MTSTILIGQWPNLVTFRGGDHASATPLESDKMATRAKKAKTKSQYRNKFIIYKYFGIFYCESEIKYSSICHDRSLGWTATCFGRPLLRCTNYFAMIKYLHPTATCLTRPADSRMLDFIPAKAANRHGSFQICGDYYDIFWSRVQHMCVFTCTHYTVNKCCWFFTPFQHCSFHLSLYTALKLTAVLYNVVHLLWNIMLFDVCVWFDIMAHMFVPCHEGPPATKGHFSSEPAVAGRGRYYCTLKMFIQKLCHRDKRGHRIAQIAAFAI